MNVRLFLSTFLMIFLAELGDKTQLTVIGRVTDPATKWTVFVAASLALVCSTLIAVQFGSVLARHLDPRLVKICAGILFIVIGGLVLAEGVRTVKPAKDKAVRSVGAIGRLILAQAATFERAAARDYESLAAKSSNPEVRDCLRRLAHAETGHLDTIKRMHKTHADLQLPDSLLEALPSESQLSHDVSASDRPALDHAIAYERSTAAFYTHVAQVTVRPALKQAFIELAQAESRHVAELTALKERLHPSS